MKPPTKHMEVNTDRTKRK